MQFSTLLSKVLFKFLLHKIHYINFPFLNNFTRIYNFEIYRTPLVITFAVYNLLILGLALN